MSLAAHFIHTCSIERLNEQDNLDEYGESKLRRSIVAEQVPCRFVARTARIAQGTPTDFTPVVTYTLLVNADLDIRGQDVITSIVDRAGTSAGGNFRVDTIQNRNTTGAHHKAVVLLKAD